MKKLDWTRAVTGKWHLAAKAWNCRYVKFDTSDDCVLCKTGKPELKSSTRSNPLESAQSILSASLTEFWRLESSCPKEIGCGRVIFHFSTNPRRLSTNVLVFSYLDGSDCQHVRDMARFRWNRHHRDPWKRQFRVRRLGSGQPAVQIHSALGTCCQSR